MAATHTVEPHAVAQADHVGHGQVYAAAIILLLANAAATKAIGAVANTGAALALLNGLGSSWAFWLAFAVAVGLAWREPARRAGPRDLGLLAGCALAAVLPIAPVAGFAATGLALALLLDRTSGRYLKAAALVLLAISVQLVWTPLLMMFLVQPLVTVDAHLVSWMIARPAHGHMVQFADGSRMMSILAGCTSVQNASTALMLYVTIVRWFRPEPRSRELLVLVGVFLSVVALNLLRLALMAQNIEMFHMVHGAIGAGVVNAIITLVGLAWAASTVRDEIFR